LNFIRMAMPWRYLAGALFLLAVACSENTQPASGIEGLVTLKPVCPEAQDVDPCENEPYETTLVIKEMERGDVVTTVQTAADGTFRVALPPGKYIVEPQEPESFVAPFADPQSVIVREGEFSAIEVVYDSGIR
jgi:hypothetical protein